MTRPVSNQLFKGLTVLYSRSGGMLVPVRWLRWTGHTCTVGSTVSFVFTHFLLYPIGGASYRWIAWYWKRFSPSLSSNTEASGRWEKVSAPFPIPDQAVHHVCCKCRGGNCFSTVWYLEMFFFLWVGLHSWQHSAAFKKVLKHPWKFSKCDSHSCCCVVAVTDEWHHEQLGGAPPSQWRWWTDIHRRRGTLHEECTGNVWVWL